MKRLSAPANDAELKEYYDACKAVEVEPADTLRKLAHAFVLQVQDKGHVVFPIRFAGTPVKKGGEV